KQAGYVQTNLTLSSAELEIQSMVDVPIHQEDTAVQRTPLIDTVVKIRYLFHDPARTGSVGIQIITSLHNDEQEIKLGDDEKNCRERKLVPSCFVIYDLELLSLSFDFVFSSEIFKSLSFRLDRLCHLAILFLDQHAHTLHHLESLLTISLDRLDIFEGRSCISEFVRKSLSLILELS
ncbi:hypothetical protein Tco_1296397, partial [Tanacetum coccineum]